MTCRLACTVLGLLFFASGCGVRSPRELPFPVFDPRSPFPELADRRLTDGVSTRVESDFEHALAGSGRSASESAPAPQSVPLGNGLTGALPGPASGWTWASEPGLTMALHGALGDADALIWAAGFTPRMAVSPSREVHRFLVTILPERGETALDPSSFRSLLGHGWSRRLAREVAVDGLAAERLLQLATTRTAGLGVGFRVSGDGSTGWRWVGRSPGGVTLRLARFSGTWAMQRRFPADLARALGRVGGKSPELVRLAGWLASPAVTEVTGPERAPTPAYLLLGSASAEHELAGAHLALLCIRAPRCPVAAELAAFLGSLQLTDPQRTARLQGSSAGRPAELAASVGIEIPPAELVLDPESLDGGESPPIPPQP